MPAIRIGINPISWSNDDLPALGGETPLSTALSEGKDIGYEGFELNGKFLKDAKGVGDVLRPYDLALVSGWYSSRLARRSVAEEMKPSPAMSAAQTQWRQRAGVRRSRRLHPGLAHPLDRTPAFPQRARLAGLRRQTHRTGALHLLSCGVRLAYHHHGRVRRIPARHRPVDAPHRPRSRPAVRFGPLLHGRRRTLEVLRRHIDRICHVHFKDVRKPVVQLARNQMWSFPTASSTAPSPCPAMAISTRAAARRTAGRRLRRLAGGKPSRTGRGAQLCLCEKGLRHLRALLNRGLK
jgi:inosose dehydratase